MKYLQKNTKSLLSVVSRIFKQRNKIKRNASKSDTVNLNKDDGEVLHSKPRLNFCRSNH